MQEIKQRIGYIIIIVAALVVMAVTWVRFEEPSFDAPQGDVVSEDNIDTTPETELPDFAYVEVRDGERVLVNERDGYEVVLEENWVPEYYTNVVEVFVRDNYPSGEMTASFYLTDNLVQDLSIDTWIERWINFSNVDCNNCYSKKNDFLLDNILVTQFIDNAGLGERYNYLFIKGNIFFDLTTANISEEKAKQIIENIKQI